MSDHPKVSCRDSFAIKNIKFTFAMEVPSQPIVQPIYLNRKWLPIHLIGLVPVLHRSKAELVY